MKTNLKPNERTFQGVLIAVVHQILKENPEIPFDTFHIEQNIGKNKQSKFADGLLRSKEDSDLYVLFELKNTNWDATADELVWPAREKAILNGFEFFVTGTPRQFALHATFQNRTSADDKKLKIYPMVPAKSDLELTGPAFEKSLFPKILDFLRELGEIVHGRKDAVWDSFDRLFVNKLSAYINDASSTIYIDVYEKIHADLDFRSRLEDYLQHQEIFNVGMTFSENDVFNLCQLSNYLLYLKIIFYWHLKKGNLSLRLKKIEIPDDVRLLSNSLRYKFNDVLKHDFELIFAETVMDEFVSFFPESFLPSLRANIDEISYLDFGDLNVDVMGAIYNTLLDAQEQHDRGQHFTNAFEVDIVNAFCLRPETRRVIDTGCGAGTFLVRAYYFMKEFSPQSEHNALLGRLWGVEIAPFPAFLATMNLALLNVKTLENYPAIIHADFANIGRKSQITFINPNRMEDINVQGMDGKKQSVEFPDFDACVGNPPYIRQELIVEKEQWIKLALADFGLKKMDKKSDLYVYYLIHTASLLREGGRLGYVISSSWLDGNFGAALQKFLLDRFKIIALIEHQNIRSFETASVNTIILIIERCENVAARAANVVRFVRVATDYADLIGELDAPDRIKRARALAQWIENPAENTAAYPDIKILNRLQARLEADSTEDGVYKNGCWGARLLRAPELYNQIIERAGDKLLPLSTVATVKYGIKSGSNEFFYLEDKTEELFKLTDKEYISLMGVPIMGKGSINWNEYGWYYSDLLKSSRRIERRFMQPLFKTQKEAEGLLVNSEKLRYFVFMCDLSKEELQTKGPRALKYIEAAEERGVHELPTLSNRKLWYNLKPYATTGEFIFPSKIGERFRLIDNRPTQIYCDKVNYAISSKEPALYSDILFLILNSTLFRYLLDLFARQLTGSQTLSDVDVYKVEATLIPNPALFTAHKDEFTQLANQFCIREQGTIFQEVEQPDRRALDKLIFKALDLPSAWVDDLYREACAYVRNRQLKSESTKTAKTKLDVGSDPAYILVLKKFPEIRTFSELLNGRRRRIVLIPETKAQIPRNLLKETVGLFDDLTIEFDNGVKKTIRFDSLAQFKLFYFFYKELRFRGTMVLPNEEVVCQEILTTMRYDFDYHFKLMESVLKGARARVNAREIYRRLIFRED